MVDYRSKASRRLPRQAGFSLTELLTVISIVAVLAAVALPSFSASINSNRLATAVNDFQSSLSLARAEAVRLDRTTTWSYDSASPAQWVLWADANANGTREAAEILQSSTLNEKLQYTGSNSGFPNVVYQPDGTITGPSLGSLYICSATPTPAANVRKLVISLSGRVRMEHCDCAKTCTNIVTSCTAATCVTGN